MKIQYKIALLFTTLTASILLLLGLFIYYFASRYSFNDFYKRLELRTVIAGKTHFEHNSVTESYGELRRNHMEELPDEQEYFLPVNGQGIVADVPASLQLDTSFFREVMESGTTVFRRYRQLSYAGIKYDAGDQQYLVIMSANNEYGRHFLDRLRNIIVFCSVGFVLLTLVISLLFSKNILKPIRIITTRTRDISVHNLNQRLPVTTGKDEVGELSYTINNMLDRIETAFESQNNFVSNASHELRTPLTAIMGEVEWALHKERNPDEYRHSLSVIMQEAERLHHLSTSLLRLAQSGFDGYKQQWESIRIEDILLSVKHTVDEIIPANQVKYEFRNMPASGSVPVSGLEHLLHLAFSNVILNACKYSNNDVVSVIVHFAGDRVEISVIDKGIGIPARDLPYIFDPFFRASNTGSFEGYGIGLPLSNNIIRMHKGTLHVFSEENKGVKVYISLPAV